MANSKYPNPGPPADSEASATITFTGLPLNVSRAPALAAKANGINIFDGLVAARLATTTVTGSSAAAAPLGVMKALSTAASTITAANSRVAPGACSLDQHLAGPGGHPGGLQALAHHEQGGDEDDHRIAESAQRRAGVQHAGEVQRESGEDRDDADRQPIPDEQPDGRTQISRLRLASVTVPPGWGGGAAGRPRDWATARTRRCGRVRPTIAADGAAAGAPLDHPPGDDESADELHQQRSAHRRIRLAGSPAGSATATGRPDE